MHQIIQLQPADDILTIRARIENADFAHLVLYVPRGCVLLESGSGLPLLRRAADDLGAQIALVTHDEGVRERAAEYGFPVFSSLTQAQRARWKMQPPTRATALRTSNIPPPPPPESVTEPFGARIFKEWRVTLLLITGALIGLCIGAFLFVPTAQVYLIPAPMVLTATTDILMDSSNPTVNSALRSVPARRILLETSGTVSLRTTVTKTVPDARSTGTVIFTNLRTEETIIPLGTVVVTSAGVPIRFTTTNTVTIPSGVGARVEAPIQAVDPGLTGNVKELSINAAEGAMALSVRVINTKPTASGSLRPVRVVTEADKKKLEELALAQLKQQAPAVLKTALKPSEFIQHDSVLVDPTDRLFDHAIDDPAEVVNLKMSADAFGLAVDRDDLDLLMGTLLQKQLPPGHQLLPNGVKVDMLPGGKYQGIQLRQPVRAVGYAAPQLDGSKVASALRGKTSEDAKGYLTSQVQLAHAPDIRISPPGWQLMPLLAFRISVFIETPTVGK